MRRFPRFHKTLVLTLVVAVTGCAEIGEPDIGSPPVSATAAETVTVPGNNPDGSSATTSPQLPPARPAGYVPSLLAATDGGVVLIPNVGPPRLLELSVAAAIVPEEDPDQTETLPIPGVPRLAIDDFFRGLVVQFEAGVVEWFQAEGGDARQINVNGGRLLDVGFFDGTTEAIVAVGPQIDRVRLVDTQRLPLLTLNPNQELLDLSAGGGLYAAVIANDECGRLLFVNAVGEEVLVSIPAAPTCDTGRRASYGSVALSSDGGAVAYTHVSYRADGVEAQTELIVVDLAGGVVVLSKIVGESGDRVSGLSFDGQRVAMVREDANAVVEMLVVSDADTVVVDLSEFGAPIAPTWARIPVAAGSVE